MEQREDLMQDAVKSLPPSPPPFSIVLLPMEGDPSAPIYFWRLARATGGALPEPGEGLAMKRRTRRDTETFSMSFLDCICCGFGAIILLLVLNEFGEPIQLEQSKEDLEGQIVKMKAEVFDIRGLAIVLERELRARIEELTEEQQRARAPARRPVVDRGQAQGEHRARRRRSKKLNDDARPSARKSMIDETRELQRASRQQVYNQPVAGVPIDSEYVIFIVDTSGSMQSQNWRYAEQKLGEVLNIYPKLKGIQVMDDEGGYMFTRVPRQVDPGLARAPQGDPRSLPRLAGVLELEPVRGHHRRGPHVLDARPLDQPLHVRRRVHRARRSRKSWTRWTASTASGKTGERLVRIHALGFPIPGQYPQHTSMRYATLMRILCGAQRRRVRRPARGQGGGHETEQVDDHDDPLRAALAALLPRPAVGLHARPASRPRRSCRRR